jgi:hypothetical protein
MSTTDETAADRAGRLKQINARIADIAPWPGFSDEATPESVARWLLVHAQREWVAHIIPLTMPDGPDPSTLDVAAVAKMNAQFAAGHALLALIGTGREAQVAQEIVRAWNGGGEVGPWLWEHLRILLVDADEVTRLEQARMALDETAGDGEAARLTADLASARELIRRLERITTTWTRGMYAARIDCRRGDPAAAAAIMSEGLDGYDGPEWDGTETGAQWWERTKAEEGL